MHEYEAPISTAAIGGGFCPILDMLQCSRACLAVAGGAECPENEELQP